MCVCVCVRERERESERSRRGEGRGRARKSLTSVHVRPPLPPVHVRGFPQKRRQIFHFSTKLTAGVGKEDAGDPESFVRAKKWVNLDSAIQLLAHQLLSLRTATTSQWRQRHEREREKKKHLDLSSPFLSRFVISALQGFFQSFFALVCPQFSDREREREKKAPFFTLTPFLASV